MFGSDISNLRLFDRENRSIRKQLVYINCRRKQINIVCTFTIIKILHYRGSERGSFFFIVWTVERFYVSNLKMKIPFLHGFHERRLEVRLRIAVAQCIIWWYYWFSAVGSVCRSYAIIYEFLFHLPFHFQGWERFDFVLHDFLSPERTFECYPCHSLY